MFRRYAPSRAVSLAAVYGLLLVALTIGVPLRTIGDGGEYLVYALSMSHGNAPPLTPHSISAVRTEIQPFDPDRAVWKMEEAGVQSADGRLDFVHFWLYPALAAPLVAVTRVLNLDPRYAFVAINVALLVSAFALLYGRLGFGPTVLLLVGPIVWWVDKVHPEVFIVALMAIALATWRDRPALAFLSAGLVAAQVAPFAVFVLVLAIAMLVDRPGRLKERAFYAALAPAVGLALLPPLYYLGRFGRPTLFAQAGDVGWPSRADLAVSFFDLNLGLFPNWPLLALVCLVSFATIIVTGPRRLLRPEIAGTLAGALVLAVACAHVGNFTHGATPGIMRYAVWMSALCVPLLAAGTHRRTTALVAAIAILSAAASLFAYRPSIDEFAHRPSGIALWVWRHVPSWSHPRPDVFARSLNQQFATVPIATPGCDKVLLVGRGETQGMWPRPCPPEAIPAECRAPGVLCYGNRSGRSYRFRPVNEVIDWLKYNRETVWPFPAEIGLRGLMSRLEWFSMTPLRDASSGVVQGVRDVQVESGLASRDNAFIVLTSPKPGARVELRVSPRAEVTLIDGSTGTSLPLDANTSGTPDTRVITLPSAHRLLVLAVSSR